MSTAQAASSKVGASAARGPNVPTIVERALGESTFSVDAFVHMFPTLAAAAGGIVALRNLVLELASHGRLVERQDQDGTGADCVGLHSDPTEGHFPIPAHWAWGVGTQIFDFVTSGSRGWAEFYSDSGPLFLRIGNLDYGTTKLDLASVQRVSPPANAEGTRTRVQAGDILISITGDTGMVGLVPEGLEAAYINQHIALARPSKRVAAPFIATVLMAPFCLGRLQSAQRGIKNSLGLDDIKRLAIPLPPLAEQSRIVARVDQLMALIDELEAKQTRKREVGAQFTTASLEALTTAGSSEELDAAWKRVIENWEIVLDRPEKIAMVRRMVVALGVQGLLAEPEASDDDVDALLNDIGSKRDRMARARSARLSPVPAVESSEAPFSIRTTWRWVRLGDLGGFLGGGTPSKANPGFWKGSIPWVSPKDMKRPYIEDAEDHISAAAVENSAVKLIPKRSLLFVVRGMILAHSFPTAVTTREVTVNQDMKALVLARPDLADFMLLVCQDARNRVLQRVERSSHGTCRLDAEVIEHLLVPLPPLAEQKRIVAKVEQLMKLCDELEAKLRRAEDRATKLVDAVVQELVA